nr:endonuclease domain-containing protein [uncultured Draconibacterium sp.]
MSEEDTPIRRARKLRKGMTKEEKLLWQQLRNRKFLGLKFLRQHPIIYDRVNYQPLYFIPDFYCAEKKLVIELDGKIHDFQKQKDQDREGILKDMGLTILRIRNEDVNSDIVEVLHRIKEFIQKMNSP